MPLDAKIVNNPPYPNLESDLSEFLEANPERSQKNNLLRP